MSTQSVFIFWESPLFYESVSWLLRHPNIEVVGATSNYALISADIASKKPNTILIEDTGRQSNRMVWEYLDSIPWELKIILLSFNDNKLNVYHHERRTMIQTDDLLGLILSEQQ